MTIIPPGGKVLGSGANGYIARWIVRCLEKGYPVRAAARSLDKGRHLLELFKSFRERFELASDSAFDEAVKGVDAIAHIASPVAMTSDDPQELTKPAVKGILGILQSVLKNGTVKRVLLTYSAAAVMEFTSGGWVFTESDWNSKAIKEVEE